MKAQNKPEDDLEINILVVSYFTEPEEPKFTTLYAAARKEQ